MCCPLPHKAMHTRQWGILNLKHIARLGQKYLVRLNSGEKLCMDLVREAAAILLPSVPGTLGLCIQLCLGTQNSTRYLRAMPQGMLKILPSVPCAHVLGFHACLLKVSPMLPEYGTTLYTVRYD